MKVAIVLVTVGTLAAWGAAMIGFNQVRSAEDYVGPSALLVLSVFLAFVDLVLFLIWFVVS